MQMLLERAAVDDAVVQVGRGINRRRFLRGAMRAGLVVGGSLAAPVFLGQQRAWAANCSVYGPTDPRQVWGTVCASTQGCGSSNCSNGNCDGIRRRCNYWSSPNTQGNFCWCSRKHCRDANLYGYYTCCDCWLGGSGDCSVGTGPCICKQFHCTGCCNGPCPCDI
jgi:hypothetical protein